MSKNGFPRFDSRRFWEGPGDPWGSLETPETPPNPPKSEVFWGFGNFPLIPFWPLLALKGPGPCMSLPEALVLDDHLRGQYEGGMKDVQVTWVACTAQKIPLHGLGNKASQQPVTALRVNRGK